MGFASHSTLVASRNVALVGVFGLACYGGYRYVLKFGHLNPFEKLEGKVSPLDANTAIRLNDVQLRHYHNGQLVTKADITQMDVSKDRSKFGLSGIKNGVYMGSKGPIQYAARNGVWNALNQELDVRGGVRAKGDQFDIQTSNATFDKRNEILRSPVPLTGTLYGGQMSATSLDFNLHTGDANAWHVRWKGKVDPGKASAILTIPGDTPGVHTWAFSGDLKQNKATGKDYWENGTATDGIVMIKAPHIVRDVATDVITATGRVTYFSGKADMIADQAVIHRREKWAVFTGDVRMFVKAKKDQDKKPQEEEIPPIKPDVSQLPGKAGGGIKPIGIKSDDSPLTDEQKKKDEELRSGKTVHDYPTQVQADKITYWYGDGDRHAHIEGHPVAKQDFKDGRWRQGWTFEAFYDGEKNIMDLESEPGTREARMKNSIGDDFKALWIKFSTDDEADDEQDVNAKSATGIFADRTQLTPDTTNARGSSTKDSKSPPAKTGGG